MKIGPTEILDTYAEAFGARYTRLIITAADDYWLDAALALDHRLRHERARLRRGGRRRTNVVSRRVARRPPRRRRAAVRFHGRTE